MVLASEDPATGGGEKLVVAAYQKFREHPWLRTVGPLAAFHDFLIWVAHDDDQHMQVAPRGKLKSIRGGGCRLRGANDSP